MTRKERDKAIRILQWLHDNNFLFTSTEEDVKYATELAMQILEQEPQESKRQVMDMYGRGEYNNDKNILYDDIKEFLKKEHSVSELMQVVTDVIKYQIDSIYE